MGWLRSEVWWIDQHVWRSRRPLNNYLGGAESLPHAAKLFSAIHSLFLQKKKNTENVSELITTGEETATQNPDMKNM